VMKKFRFTLNLLALAVLVMMFSSLANAQATRTWVSGVGDDANPCSRTAPCKTFPGAISKTAAGGEIDCLDPGGFGQVTITKSITIDCDSGPGGVLAGAGSGIVINANAATDVINIRSVNIEGSNVATNGINILSAKAVHLLDMNIKDVTGACVNVAASATVFLTIRDTQLSECAVAGVQTSTSAGIVAGDYDNVWISSTGNGVGAGANSHLTIHNSTITLSTVGVNQTASGGVFVAQSAITLNTTALQSAAGGSLGASSNILLGNGTVFNPNGGSISSGGDNPQFQNGATGVANGPAVTKI